jgi:OCT family organic cation transporter-like MFS transporter 4/5
MDDLINRAGSFGIYQRSLLSIVGFVSALCGFTQFMTVFNNAVPKFNCTLSSDLTAPLPSETCEIFFNTTTSLQLGLDSPYQCSFSAEYGHTTVSEWHLICDRIGLATLPATLYQTGALSSFIVGFLSDRYGRKKLCICMSTILFTNILVCEVLQRQDVGLAWYARFLVYSLSQFVLGLTVHSLDMVTFVLLIEMTVPTNANPIGIFNFIMYVVGELVLLLICFICRDWRAHNRASGFFSLVSTFLIVAFLPESPRFLVVKGRLGEATQALLKMAKRNRREDRLSYEGVMSELCRLMDSGESTLMVSHDMEKDNKDECKITGNQQTLVEYLLNPGCNAVNAVLCAYICLSIILVYYGASTGKSVNFDMVSFLLLHSSMKNFVQVITCKTWFEIIP